MTGILFANGIVCGVYNNETRNEYFSEWVKNNYAENVEKLCAEMLAEQKN